MTRYGKPEIFNTYLGSQFTSQAFTGVPWGGRIAMSMGGRGDWRNNVVVERLWRSVKYEEVYLHAYASVSEARSSTGQYLGFYNARRPPLSLGGRTPSLIAVSSRNSRKRHRGYAQPDSRSRLAAPAALSLVPAHAPPARYGLTAPPTHRL